MAEEQRLVIQLAGGGPWGFRLKGGSTSPLQVAKLRANSKSQQAGLKEGDVLLAVNGESVLGKSYQEAMNMVDAAGNDLSIEIQRGGTPPAAPHVPVRSLAKSFVIKPVSEPPTFGTTYASTAVSRTSLLSDGQTTERTTTTAVTYNVDGEQKSYVSTEKQSFPGVPDSKGEITTPRASTTLYLTSTPAGKENAPPPEPMFKVSSVKVKSKKAIWSPHPDQDQPDAHPSKEHHEVDGTSTPTSSVQNGSVVDISRLPIWSAPHLPPTPQEARQCLLDPEEMASALKKRGHKIEALKLRKILTPSEFEDETPLSPTSHKKKFADSAFYDAPGELYPTVNEQVQMARKIAKSLEAAANKRARGGRMYAKRKRKSSKWVHVGYTVGSVSGYSSEGSLGEGLGRLQDFDDIEPDSPHPDSHNLEGMYQYPGHVPLWPVDTLGEYGERHGDKAVLTPQEVERLRLGQDKCRHNVVSPQMCFNIAKDLQKQKGRGATIFAKRRERADKYIIDETNVKSPPPPPVALTRKLEEVVAVKTYKSPWEAAMENPFSLDDAFTHINHQPGSRRAVKSLDMTDLPIQLQPRPPESWKRTSTSSPVSPGTTLGGPAPASGSQFPDHNRKIRGWTPRSAVRAETGSDVHYYSPTPEATSPQVAPPPATPQSETSSTASGSKKVFGDYNPRIRAWRRPSPKREDAEAWLSDGEYSDYSDDVQHPPIYVLPPRIERKEVTVEKKGFRPISFKAPHPKAGVFQVLPQSPQTSSVGVFYGPEPTSKPAPQSQSSTFKQTTTTTSTRSLHRNVLPQAEPDAPVNQPKPFTLTTVTTETKEENEGPSEERGNHYNVPLRHIETKTPSPRVSREASPQVVHVEAERPREPSPNVAATTEETETSFQITFDANTGDDQQEQTQEDTEASFVITAEADASDL
ncbi:synaptopodin 2-like protein [Lingula anatina]|uniref:Synaptopodin 2-like protein n=1 Tax=Lingula anatina TaxID=7574 RepID=A0A1S3I7Z1_LINAN|nr:synaptopodin 2-like protein [Lingula anatina]|eukprot:XP_013394385.1 synaptopodin 2-like protein [Lingula anatina]